MDIEKELEPLKPIADREQVAIITFVAPDKLIRISPTTYGAASISTGDAYQLEEVVEKNCKGITKAFLLLHSPGGSLTSSYNIARFLRKRFEFLQIFVPYAAASGATLMSLAGNKITLGELGYLTPIDPQVLYKGEWVSCFGIVEEVDYLEGRFKNLRPEEMPIPWRQMAEKLDVIHYREMDTKVWEAQQYARKLLLSAGYEEPLANKISRDLARTYYSHDHCLHREDCMKMGLKIDSTENAMNYLFTLKTLIHSINKKEDIGPGHYITATAPTMKQARARKSIKRSQRRSRSK